MWNLPDFSDLAKKAQEKAQELTEQTVCIP